jgi:hypothetical protein
MIDNVSKMPRLFLDRKALGVFLLSLSPFLPDLLRRPQGTGEASTEQVQGVCHWTQAHIIPPPTTLQLAVLAVPSFSCLGLQLVY